MNVSLTNCCAPVQVRIMLSVLQFRLNRRYVQADPPFVAIELDQSDSGREGCAVSTLTITSEPKDWRGAIQVLQPCSETVSPVYSARTGEPLLDCHRPHERRAFPCPGLARIASAPGTNRCHQNA